MTAQTLAIAYAALALLPGVMHIALAAGAPLGRFTVGGQFPAGCRQLGARWPLFRPGFSQSWLWSFWSAEGLCPRRCPQVSSGLWWGSPF